MTRRHLPIGIQTFREICEGAYSSTKPAFRSILDNLDQLLPLGYCNAECRGWGR